MPHTNITGTPQKVYTKQDPANFVIVEPGETIEGEAMRCLQITPQEADDCAETKAGNKPKSVEKTKKQKKAESDAEKPAKTADT